MELMYQVATSQLSYRVDEHLHTGRVIGDGSQCSTNTFTYVSGGTNEGHNKQGMISQISEV
jgi:hypothetical protein